MHAVGDDEGALAFEYREIVGDLAAEEVGGVERRLIDEDLDSLGLDALHDALDR